MTEVSIIRMFQQKRCYEAELSIMQDCSDHLLDSEQSDWAHKHALLKRRIALMNHWLGLLAPIERLVIEDHLIQHKSWTQITAQIVADSQNEIACDERTLQRQQAKAIKHIFNFMGEQFGDLLDFLVD